MKADASLQDKLKGVTDPQAIIAIAKEAGFEISAESIQQQELSDQDLERVAGGEISFGCDGTDCGLVQTGCNNSILGIFC